MDFTNEVWKALVEKKVTEVLADTSTTDYAPGITSADENFARTIDHTLLKPDATPSQINQLCDEAIKYGFRVKPLSFRTFFSFSFLEGGGGKFALFLIHLFAIRGRPSNREPLLNPFFHNEKSLAA